MKLILIIICLLLLFYQFESAHFLTDNKKNALVVWWNIKSNKHLLHIFPHDEYVLIDKNAVYFYINKYDENTYTPVIKMGEQSKLFMLNHKYLTSFVKIPPKIYYYPNNLTNLLDVVNYFAT